MVIFFRTRAEARNFASHTQRKAPTKQAMQGWPVRLNK